ncbi:ATP-dependent helicase [Eilatimonas milleporae]|uniref:DNA 3'-5' helicase n=1 Tax=Eilatimonas milleporae TaxID=911205 RepID=A0A3M0CQD5_9PROT|nr:UvrD-helicase domain-containing protein [Eilatimonas milleporae]RMB11758.1 DNA helicase-2/ATP-dependent DNA helicase PcrA [Eilatimonas milleporae]
MTHDPAEHHNNPSPRQTAPKADAERGQPLYLEGLNPPQREAVLKVEGPLLVLAGAGTGKTRVLTTRIGHLIASGHVRHPSQILAVTFTNKAAREMQERTSRLLGHPVEGLWIGTFHAICVRILRRNAELAGLNSNFTILDTDDQIRLLKQLLAAENIDDKRWPARILASLIDRWKNRALSPEQLPGDETQAFANGLGGKLYAAYQARLQTLNACDFGDLLLHVIRLFQKHPDILAQYHRQFRYILVDEYQDTNVAQYLWLRLLAQNTGGAQPAKHNICCVGDDDQSIYGWRGAEVGNILRFSQDFPGAEVVRLEQNYRSTGHILGAASALIAANEGRLGKTLWTDAGNGEPVRVSGVWDAPEEARAIGDEIESLQTKGHGLNDIAILVRAGFQTREFEERLITLGLPYRVVGGPRFYERAEIRDAMAYLRVIAQPSDDLAFERIINVPKRGLGSAALQKLHGVARQHSLPLTRAARHPDLMDQLRPQARRSLTGLMDDFDRWREALATENHAHVTEMVLEESGYTGMWQQDKSPDAPGRLDNLKELVTAIGEFENLAGFLEHIALVMDNDENDEREKVSVMTLHSAKGLEFDTVFLPGWEEGIFPNQRSLDEAGLKALEEERRLAYVGLTRARQRAHIFFAGNRQVFGQWQASLPSRFLDDLPVTHVETDTAQGLYGNSNRAARGGWGSGSWGDADDSFADMANTAPYEAKQDVSYGDDKYGPGWKRAQSQLQKTHKRRAPVLTQKAETTRTVSPFAVGERVFHDKFGYGTVEDVEGTKLLIRFDKAGDKRVMDQFVKSADTV